MTSARSIHARIIRSLAVARTSAAAPVLPGKRRSRPGTTLGRAVLVLLGVALALLAVETVLRLGRQERHFVWRPGLSRRFHAAPGVMPGVTGEARFRVNSLGLRGDEPPASARRVLVLGGSAAECLYLDQDEAWPGLLQSRLGPGVWVGNAGRSGLDSRHHRVEAPLLLDEMPGVEALVVLAGVNDLLRRLARGDGWRPFDPRSAAERGELVAAAFEVIPERRTELPWWARTAVADWVLRHARRVPGAFAQDSAASVYEVWRAHRRSAGEVREVLPDLRPALEEHRRNLRAVVAAARRRGARPLLVTQPALWRPGLPPELEERLWMGGVGEYQRQTGRPYYSAGALRRGLDAFNATLLSTCAELPGAACFDLASVVSGDAASFYDDVHFNEAGSRRVARALAPVVADALGAAEGPGR